MRHLTTLLAAMCALGASAASPGWQLSSPQSAETLLQPSAALLQAPAHRAPVAVTEPKGDLYTYALTNVRVNEAGMAKNCGVADSLYVDGSTVYFLNLVDSGADGSYAVGTLTEGDMTNGTITFENGVEYAAGRRAYIGTADAESRLVADRDAASFTFTIANGVINSVCPHPEIEALNNHCYIMGYRDSGGIVGYNIDYTLEPVPSDLQNVTIPPYVRMKTYEAVCQPYGKAEASKFITYIGIDQKTVYMKNIIPALGPAVLKGKIGDDGRIAFDVMKYIGKYDNIYVSFWAGQITTNPEDGTYTLLPVNTDKLYMDYDKASGNITASDVLVFLAGSKTLGGYWNQPAFTLYTDKPVKVPSDATATRYAMSSRSLPDVEDSRRSREAWVMRDGDDFYFKSFYADNKELAFKGTLGADGKSIDVAVPQYMGAGYQDQPIFLGMARHISMETAVASAVFQYDPEEGTVSFSYDPQSGEISYDRCLCTTVYGTGSVADGLDYPRWTMQNDVVATVPETAETTTYLLRCDRVRDYSRNSDMNCTPYLTSVAVEGDNYYFHGLNEDYSATNDNAVLTGVRQGDKVVCPMPQYISDKSGDMIYAYAADYGTSTGAIHPNDNASVEFALDPETGALSLTGSIAVMTASGAMRFFYVNPVYTPYEPKPAKPKSGIPAPDYDELNNGSGMRYAHTVELFFEDTEGNYLDPKNLTYSIFLDGEQYTFPNSVYFQEFDQDVTEIPMLMETANFNCYLCERRIWTPAPANETFGVQVHYYCGDVRTDSDITTIDKATGEITVTPVGDDEPQSVGTPANPTPERWRERSADLFDFMFSMPEEDTDGHPLDASKLAYRIFFDEEPYTFTTELYRDLQEDMTEVPAETNTDSFNKAGTDYMIKLHAAPASKIGVQSVYRDGDNVSRSQIGYYDLATGEVTYADDPESGITARSGAKSVQSVEYYLPTGVRVSRPVKGGIYIVRTLYTDSTITSEKTVVR